MSAHALLRDVQRRAHARTARNIALLATPWSTLAVAIAWRSGGLVAAVVVLLIACAFGVLLVRHRLRRLDTVWLGRALDARRPDLEDSTDLLLAPRESMTALERLQRTRIEQRIVDAPAPDLRAPWSTRAIAASAVVATLAILAVLAWPKHEPVTFDNVLAQMGVATAPPTHTRIVDQALRIVPPAYTRQPARDSQTLDAKAPQNTRLQWTLHFFPQPASAELVFHDGRRLPLKRTDDDAWEANDILARSALYRIVLHDAPPLQKTTLHRLDAIADRPPDIRVVQPDRGLTLMRTGQRTWALAFDASDDYAVAATGTLRVTVAHGSGEAITFRESERRIGGAGGPASRRFAAQLDLAALKLEEGDDLVVQLRVDDTRSPSPQSARSASVILRWPPDLGGEATGVEGMVRKVLPAYFRSQRQIIIDAEGLLKQKRSLAAETYAKRSDEIGVDQRILRMRYGQFLGEEAEGEPQPPPTNDASNAPASAATAPDAHAHDEAPPAAPAALGQDTNVLQQFGHTHDEPEAATLLDPETRATLKLALDQMWQSELHLRQGKPDDALPFAYRALGFIKQVQQATRIYLARVGTELPPIDESRRMGGDRAGLQPARDPLAPGATPDPALAHLWRDLDDDAKPVDLAAVERWLGAHQSDLRDPLAFVAALEALRAEPGCAKCRQDLRALLWPVLPRPASNVQRRTGDDAQAKRYLDALREARAP